MSDTKYWLAFSQISKIGPKRFEHIRNFFPNLEYAWSANYAELREALGDEKLVGEIMLQRQNIDPDAELLKLEKENIKIVRVIDKEYPRLLKEIYNPPFLLYYKGDLNNLHEQTLAIVGSRKITNYGRNAAEHILSGLFVQDIIVVSGLALGVDALAHEICVANGKTTVAVLGGGLDRQNIYPSSNRFLAQKILDNNGLLISEFPLGTLPAKFNFPLRNRIISGLSLGVLVIEAGESSGALITAKYALDHNREVFAVPGPITNSMSIGTNNLIKQGAKLTTSAQDIFDELNFKQLQEFKTNQNVIPDSPEEAMILKYLQNEPKHINELVRMSDLTVTEVSSTLMILEMKGLIKNLGNMVYMVKV